MYNHINRCNPCYVCPCCRCGQIGPFPPTPCQTNFRFTKVDACTDLPLEGAVFELSQRGSIVGVATSNGLGAVSFAGLCPGTYTLTEVQSPQYYKANAHRYEIRVCEDGTIEIDGDRIRNFVVRDFRWDQSAPPAINAVPVTATAVTGTGSPGCSILVTWPDGTTSTTTVLADGSFTVAKPATVVLQVSDLIRASQTCSEHLPSDDTYIAVTA